MEKELKTLKDIELYCGACQDEECCDEKKDRIKAEAVKWVKTKEKKFLDKNQVIEKRLTMDRNDFLDFFNISEEDLK